MKTFELKPCPFCGSESKMKHEERMNGIESIWVIQCQNPDCRTQMHKYISTYFPDWEKLLMEFVEQWNRRINDYA